MGRWLVGIVVGIIVNGLAIGITAAVLPGIHVNAGGFGDRIWVLIILGAVFGVVNAIIKPVVSFLSFPVTVLTLGLFQLVINGLLLLLVSLLVKNLVIDNFGWAILGALIMGIVGATLEAITRGLRGSDKKASRAA